MKNILTLLAKNVLAPSELTAAALATDAVIQKKIYESQFFFSIIMFTQKIK